MKRVILVLLMSVFLVSTANAMDVGFGMGFSNSYYDNWGATVYVPLNIAPSFRLEPYLMYADNEVDSTSSSGASGYSFSEMELGVGAFGIRKINPSTQLYFGAKLSYINIEADDFSTGGSYSSDGDGYQIAPTLGFEYFFNENISLGGEASWFYANIDTDDYDSFSGYSSDSVEATGTATEVILRYYF